MIEISFRVCRITTNDPGKARNDEFLKKIMNSVKGKLADEEEEHIEMKILFHVYNRLIMITLKYYALLPEFKFFYFLFSCPFS